MTQLLSIDWSFAGYSKDRKSQGPDLEGLEAFALILGIFLQLAPNAVANFKSIERGLLALMLQVPQIVPPGANADDHAIEAASKIQLMLQHLRQMRDNRKTPLASAAVNQMLDQIDPEAEPPTWHTAKQQRISPLLPTLQAAKEEAGIEGKETKKEPHEQERELDEEEEEGQEDQEEQDSGFPDWGSLGIASPTPSSGRVLKAQGTDNSMESISTSTDEVEVICSRGKTIQRIHEGTAEGSNADPATATQRIGEGTVKGESTAGRATAIQSIGEGTANGEDTPNGPIANQGIREGTTTKATPI